MEQQRPISRDVHYFAFGFIKRHKVVAGPSL